MNEWLILITSYLLGSFPTSLLIVKLFTGKDVRDSGSGNAGGFNTWRLVSKQKGWKTGLAAFLIVAAVDVGKAMLAVYLAVGVFRSVDAVGITLATAGVILGHNYPFYLRFYGGRGAACLMGVMLFFGWKIPLVWILTVMTIIVLVEIIIVGSSVRLTGKFIYRALSEQIVGRLIGEVIALIPVYLIEPKLFGPVAAGTALIIWRHKERLEKQLRTRSN